MQGPIFRRSGWPDVQVESRVQILLGNIKSFSFAGCIPNNMGSAHFSWISLHQLKSETKHDRVRLVKFHNRNLGIRKPSHPPFLEVAQEVAHMLDYIVVTYIYMERMRRDVEDEKENL